MRRIAHPARSPDRLAPIQCVRPGPRILRQVKPIAGPDKVVRGGYIISRIRHDPAPSIVPRPRSPRARQPEIKGVSPVLLQDPNPDEISSVRPMQGSNDACKGNRQGLVICKPPVDLIELRNGR